MSNFNSIIIAIIGITLALATAEPPRFRQSNRFGNLRLQNFRELFARQENVGNAAPSSAPYPPTGVTPDIPFDLPTETEAPLSQPDQTYGPPEQTPDQTYLPPEPTPDKTYGPPEPTPDQTYGPPEEADIPEKTQPNNTYNSATTNDKPVIEEPDAEVLPSSQNLVSEKIIQPRKNLRARSRTPIRRTRSHQSFNEIDNIHSKPVLIYTLH